MAMTVSIIFPSLEMGSAARQRAWPMKVMLQTAVSLILFSLLTSTVRQVAAWTVPAHVDLTWPPPQRENYLQKAGKPQPGPKAATEDAFSDHSFSIDFYMGHLRDSNIFRNKCFFEHFSLQQYSWTAPNCTHPFDVVEWVMYKDQRNVTSEEEIIGLNLTFAMLIEDLTGRLDVYERVDQCAYVTLVNSSDFNFTAAGREGPSVSIAPPKEQGLRKYLPSQFTSESFSNPASFTIASLDESSSPAAKLSDSQEDINGQAVSTGIIAVHPPAGNRDTVNRQELANIEEADDLQDLDPNRGRSPPPRYPYPASEASGSTSFSTPHTRPAPPPFFDLYEYASAEDLADDHFESLPSNEKSPAPSTAHPASAAAPAYAPSRYQSLPPDNKPESSGQKSDDPNEPPPAYTEGYSPLLSFTYLMAAAGGASSIITQVQQGGPGPINTIGDVGADETITMDLRGTRFVLSRDELLTLPEFVLLSLFPNGLFPEGHMGGFAEGDAVQVDVSTQKDVPITQATATLTPSTSPSRLVTSPTNASLPRSSTTRNLLSNIDVHFTNLPSQYDPASLQYMLDFFRNVAQSIPNESSPNASPDGGAMPIDSLGGSRDDGSKRAGIIAEMIEVKRAAARALLKQNGIFSGLKRSDEPGTTEAHLIEMLTAGGFDHDDRWGHRAGEPNKAVVCSLALARLRSDIRGNDMGNNAVGMAQKLLLFWRKPARRCWWEGVDLENVEGVDGPLKVWIRRVWTLEMSVIGLR
ncbi:BTB/POZ fold protein [Apiospora arundinis]